MDKYRKEENGHLYLTARLGWKRVTIGKHPTWTAAGLYVDVKFVNCGHGL